VANTQSGWDAAFYADAAGNRPVKDFLDELEATDPSQVDTIYRKFEIFRTRGWEESVASGLLKHVEEKIFEIKVKGHPARVLGFGWHKLFIAASAEIKKKDDLDPGTIRAAKQRCADWIGRYGT
jgi:hypothetical protein